MAEPKVTIDKKAGSINIQLPLTPDGTLTKNGNSRLLATTHGTITIYVDGKPVRVGVNVTTDK